VTTFSHEVLFYIGLATFLHVTDRVQRPYLQYSSKRWGLITGLRGYLFSAFFTMGLKIIAPLILLFVTWSAIRIAAFVAITPFLVGCVAQMAFEKALDNRGSSCWPLVPAIFEVCLFVWFKIDLRSDAAWLFCQQMAGVYNWNLALPVISL